MAEDTFYQQTDAPAPPPPPSPPTVDMKTAAEGLPPDFGNRPDPDRLNKPTFERKEEEPQQQEAPPAAAPAATPPALESLNQQIRNLESRLADQQTAYQMAAQQRNSGADLLQAIDAREQQRAAAMQQAQSLAPPQVQDHDALLQDGKLVEQTAARYADWGYRRAQAEYAPLIDWASQVMTVQPALLGITEDYAWRQAAELSVGGGDMSAEEFSQLRGSAREIIASYSPHPAQVQATLLNPEAIRWAAQMARQRLGKPAPIQGDATPPPSPPSGGQRPRAASSTGKPAFIAEAEKRFGVKIPDEKVEAYKQQFGG